MREVLSVSIDKGLKQKVDKAAKMLHVSKSELVKKAIEKYIAHENLKELRAILVPLGEKAGYLTDEDIFNDIS
ncbi:MAG TPA: ribbon-helix-helix protein, CopG family [Spirochaetota bacterium]|nr:ribbon-helix-helix protein, CopG family [Spirochaetota bacterium]HQO02801.1 ribbon-helix-helix protein, CopG family [Spirochaetota bacterium]HQP50521.1 ribbon-helix-helix protein, CopG family [Spirochaetota bacterium]